MKLCALLLAAMLCTLCVGQASALEYTMNAPDDYLFGRPTSDDTIYEWENPNVDRSKNTALIPPTFGSPTSYLPGTGTPLTPNLIPGALTGGGLVTQTGGVTYPTVGGSPGGNSGAGSAATGWTDVTGDLYYSGGHLGTLKIPAIGLSTKVYQGTGSSVLAKGAGHFLDMVIVDGHNRQKLCQQHGIPYEMAVFSFVDLLEAKQWALDTQKGRRNLDKWELGKIALKLKPDIEARARRNMSAGGGDQKSEDAKSGLATLPNPISPIDTRKELADTVGLGERTMGKVMQIGEHAPPAVKEALDSGDLSINQGYNITRQVRDLPEERREEAAALAVELEKAKKEIRQGDEDSARRHKIAGLFCKAFEKAVLLTPTEENVRIWAECTRMNQDEIRDSAQEARELAAVFTAIANILGTMLKDQGGNESIA